MKARLEVCGTACICGCINRKFVAHRCIECAGEFYERYKAAIETGILLPDSQQASCAKQLSALGDQLAAYTRALACHRRELASYQVRVLEPSITSPLETRCSS